MYPNSTWKLDQLNPKNKSLTHTHTHGRPDHTRFDPQKGSMPNRRALCVTLFSFSPVGSFYCHRVNIQL
jgi:hypothetical protein